MQRFALVAVCASSFILAMDYYDKAPDFVLTMETKGIPVALMTAQTMGVPLVIARRDSRAYEGSAVKINYISGEAGDRIETMALARRAVSPGQRALIIDDFMKGGGTLRITILDSTFNAASGVLVENVQAAIDPMQAAALKSVLIHSLSCSSWNASPMARSPKVVVSACPRLSITCILLSSLSMSF